MSHSGLFPLSRPDLHIGLSVQMATESSFGWWLVAQYDSSAFLLKRTSRTIHTRKPDTQLAVSRDPKWRLSNTLRLDKNITITIVTHLVISWWASITLMVRSLSVLMTAPRVTKAQSLCKLSTNHLVGQEWPSAKQLPGNIFIQGFPNQQFKTECWQAKTVIKKKLCAYNTSLPHWATYACNYNKMYLGTYFCATAVQNRP